MKKKIKKDLTLINTEKIARCVAIMPQFLEKSLENVAFIVIGLSYELSKLS